jgi:protein-S-isoprenylcysteine O-methyltransferase Ste14
LTDVLAIITLIFWPIIPLFWIPLHFAANFFRKLAVPVFMMPMITWLLLAYLIYQNRVFLINSKIDLPVILNIIGIPFFILGSLLHIWTARLLGPLVIIGVPEISTLIKNKLVIGWPFSIVRHPTYLAHTLIFSGVFLITGVIAVGIITLLDFILINTIIIPLEEKELLKRFGEDYLFYKKKVPSRFFPKFLRREKG